MNKQIFLVTAEMGLGHIRAIKPLEFIFNEKTQILGKTEYSSRKVKNIWKNAQKIYYWFSRVSQLPVIGREIYSILDKFLRIEDISVGSNGKKPTFQVRLLEYFIKIGICDELPSIQKYQENIFITSFYAPVAFIANETSENFVFCQICDTDLNRVWVPDNPNAKNVFYFSPCSEVSVRLQWYGVDQSRIKITGFPLPHSLVGGRGQEIAIENYEKRLSFLKKNKSLSTNNPYNIVYVEGGAGAMGIIAKKAALSLKKYIEEGAIRFTVIPSPLGNSAKKIQSFKRRYFKNTQYFHVVESQDLDDYFDQFSKAMKDVHILWTKPSELTFYSSLGIPIIMAPPLGAQEIANRKWLLSNNIGIDQQIPNRSHIWLNDLIESGMLWPMAKNGWVNGNRIAIYSIQEFVKNKLSNKH